MFAYKKHLILALDISTKDTPSGIQSSLHVDEKWHKAGLKWYENVRAPGLRTKIARSTQPTNAPTLIFHRPSHFSTMR